MRIAEGDFCYYVLSLGKRVGEIRPAIVTRINEDTTVDVFVFASVLDVEMGSEGGSLGPVKLDEPGPKNPGKSPGTIHYTRRVPQDITLKSG